LARSAACPLSGEILAEEGVVISAKLAEDIQNAGVDALFVLVEGKEVKVISNATVKIDGF